MTTVHIIGDLFLAEFVPVKSSTAGEQPAFEVRRLTADPSAHSSGIWTSVGGAARVASLLAPHVDSLTLSAPLGKLSRLEGLLTSRRTRSDAPIKLNSFYEEGAVARVLRAYTKVSAESDPDEWKLAFRLEFPQVLASSAVKARVDAAEVFVLADYGRGTITESVLKKVVRHKPDHLIIYAANQSAEVYRHLAPCDGNIVVLCTDRSALGWASLPNPPDSFPLEGPSDYSDLLALVLGGLIKAFPSVNYFVVICKPDSQRCFIFARNLEERCWSVYYCEGREGEVQSTRERVPGSSSAFLAAFTRRLLRDGANDMITAVSEATRTGISCVTQLLEKGMIFDKNHFGRPEEINDQSVPLAKTGFLTDFAENIAEVVSTTQMPTGLLGHAQLYGQLPDIVDTLPGYYLPESQRENVNAVISTLDSYITRRNHKRPFNMLLSAFPGSGKSYFVQCLARRLTELAASGEELHPLLEFNLSSIGNVSVFEDQLLDIYQDVRDERAAGRMPIVMLDEFDSLLTTSGKGADAQMSVIFAKMLAPLWDGVFAFEKKTRRLGGFVLIMVVSDEKFLQKLGKVGKGKDFESRIDIHFTLPEPEGDEKLEAQVRVALPMLKKHFGDTVSRVELAVLDAIGRATFPRRNRGIDQLFLLSTRPSDSTFRVQHLAPSTLIARRIATGLDLKASTKRFGRSVVRCT